MSPPRIDDRDWSALTLGERIRQIEETAEHIVVLAGPISYLLASDAFDDTLSAILRENIPADLPYRDAALQQAADIMAVLAARKATFRSRSPGVGGYDRLLPRGAGVSASVTRLPQTLPRHRKRRSSWLPRPDSRDDTVPGDADSLPCRLRRAMLTAGPALAVFKG